MRANWGTRADAARPRRRGMLDATSQELKAAMAKLEETRCMRHISPALLCDVHRHDAAALCDHGHRCFSLLMPCRGELGTRTSENQLIKSSYHLLKR